MTLPALTVESNLAAQYKAFVERLKMSDFTGDIETAYSARIAHATDNSVYYKVPQAIIYPKSTEDCQCIGKLASHFPDVAFSARGGGTGTNGQSLTDGIVVDIRRYLNEIIELNLEEGWVRVQAGIVKDSLNDALRPHGLFFSPDLSTSNRATLGGMISTDASGQGSLVYGKTSDHVIGLKAVLANGEIIETAKISRDEALLKASGCTSEAAIYQQAMRTCIQHRESILKTFPRLNRFLTGYDLEHVVDGDNIDIGRLITGAEGSLGFVTEATLTLDKIAPLKALVNISYRSFDAALRHAPVLVKAKATSVETIDSTVLNFAKTDIVWHSIHHLIADVPDNELLGLNLVEYNADSAEEMKVHIEQLEAAITQEIGRDGSSITGYSVTYDKPDIQRIYAMRKKAVGLLGKVKGNQKPIAFAEDTAVPPENLADFIGEFRALLDSHNLKYGMFGHVDAGVLHVRPALDLSEPQQEALMHTLSDEVVALVAKYGGLMWGEHGKGFRSEYGPAFFGKTLFNEMRKIKAVFDPHNQMNPGKICTPIESDDKLVSVRDIKRAGVERVIPVSIKQDMFPAFECNGNGLCFNYEPTSPMCPSSKVTHDRRHTPKGRASMLREWTRLLSLSTGFDTTLKNEGLSYKQFKSNFLSRFKNSILSNKPDFSHEVKEVMDGCLACKSCTHQCPVNIDVPHFRSIFLSIYYRRYLRPLKDMLVANIETIAPLSARAPKLHNALIELKWVKRFLEKQVGYKDAPQLSYPTLTSRVKAQTVPFDLQRLSQMNTEERKNYIAVVQDPFTSYYDAASVEKLISVIYKLGFKPIVVPYTPNGKPAHVKGFLDKFEKQAIKTANLLNQLHALDITMVGTDASLVLCYRDEYKKYLRDKRGNFFVHTIDEWLDWVLTEKHIVKAMIKKRFSLLAHCSEKTAMPALTTRWQSIFEKLGANLTVQPSGCCGMAGTYGHEASHYKNSKALYELSWSGVFKQCSTQHEVLVSGFSCRSQVARFEGKKPRHPIAVVNELIQ